MSRRNRTLILFGLLVAACVTYLCLFGVQTLFVLEAHKIGRQIPFLKRTPIELTDLSVSQTPGMKLAYFGYDFEIPWTDIDNEKTKIVGGNKAIIAFHSGNALMVWSAPPHEFMNSLLEDMKTNPETFRKIYGDGVLQSDYSLMRLILETTPNRITLSATREWDTSQVMLLMVKGICVPGDPASGIFDVRGKEFKGFQYGRPQSPPKKLNVELFPEGGHLDIFFGQKSGGGTFISQGDINRVIQTIHRVPAEAAGVDANFHK
jgi:hypothetical protein